MQKFSFNLMILITFMGCLPFLTMLLIYVNWKANNPVTTGVDIGWGMVILSACVAGIPFLLWAFYGFVILFTSKREILGPYFESRQRRIGLILLGISCLFCAGWVRSFYTTDTLTLFDGQFVSHDGVIERSLSTFIMVGKIGTGTTTIEWSVPYLLIVVPLAAISAWLIFSKSRMATSGAEAISRGHDERRLESVATKTPST